VVSVAVEGDWCSTTWSAWPRLARGPPDRGDAPNALGRGDIEAFLHRLAFLVADEQLELCQRVSGNWARTRSFCAVISSAVA
jgi:hypothetical protein